MFIANMTIKEGEAPPFSGRVEFAFDKHVNVFIGPNGSGKSTLLQQVLDNYQREWAGSNAADTSEPELAYFNGKSVHLTTSEHCGFALEDLDADDDRGKYDVIIIPATRVRYGSAPNKDGLIVDLGEHDFFGVENLAEVFYEDYIHSTVSALQRIVEGNPVEDDGRQYSDYELLHPFVEAAARTNPVQAASGLIDALSTGHQCAREICQEVVMGDAPLPETVVEPPEPGSGLLSDKARTELGLLIQTSDVQNGRRASPLNVTSLSSGIEGTLWWTRLVALSLLFMNECEPGWRQRRAYLLIDEIENHLHPTWQRRVIPALLEHFPGLQIFATTHSPFVVAGLKAGQVHLLNRDENGVITASTNDHDIIGWTTDEILRTFMGVDEPTDQLTIDRRERLLELRRQDSLTAEEETEMSELRRQVNEDFLSSSTPLEAQRERYGDMMLEFLRSRQSELSQDGS